MKITHQQLQDAMEFINYNIKEGVYEQEQFDDMTDEEIVVFARKEEARAEWMAEQ